MDASAFFVSLPAGSGRPRSGTVGSVGSWCELDVLANRENLISDRLEQPAQPRADQVQADQVLLDILRREVVDPDLGPGAVVLHVYSLSDSLVFANRILAFAGPGAVGGGFHVGVEAFGSEWSYGRCGVQADPPRTQKCHVYQCSVHLGHTPLNVAQFARILHDVAQRWRGNDYDIIGHNCCVFARELIAALRVGDMPAWVDRFARIIDGGRDAGRGLQALSRKTLQYFDQIRVLPALPDFGAVDEEEMPLGDGSPRKIRIRGASVMLDAPDDPFRFGPNASSPVLPAPIDAPPALYVGRQPRSSDPTAFRVQDGTCSPCVAWQRTVTPPPAARSAHQPCNMPVPLVRPPQHVLTGQRSSLSGRTASPPLLARCGPRSASNTPSSAYGTPGAAPLSVRSQPLLPGQQLKQWSCKPPTDVDAAGIQCRGVQKTAITFHPPAQGDGWCTAGHPVMGGNNGSPSVPPNAPRAQFLTTDGGRRGVSPAMGPFANRSVRTLQPGASSPPVSVGCATPASEGRPRAGTPQHRFCAQEPEATAAVAATTVVPCGPHVQRPCPVGTSYLRAEGSPSMLLAQQQPMRKSCPRSLAVPNQEVQVFVPPAESGKGFASGAPVDSGNGFVWGAPPIGTPPMGGRLRVGSVEAGLKKSPTCAAGGLRMDSAGSFRVNSQQCHARATRGEMGRGCPVAAAGSCRANSVGATPRQAPAVFASARAHAASSPRQNARLAGSVFFSSSCSYAGHPDSPPSHSTVRAQSLPRACYDGHTTVSSSPRSLAGPPPRCAATPTASTRMTFSPRSWHQAHTARSKLP